MAFGGGAGTFACLALVNFCKNRVLQFCGGEFGRHCRRNERQIIGFCLVSFFSDDCRQLFFLRNPVFEKTAAFVCELDGRCGLSALFGYGDERHFKRKMVVQQQRVNTGQIAQDCVYCLFFGAFSAADKCAVGRVGFDCFFADNRTHDGHFFSRGEQVLCFWCEFGDVRRLDFYHVAGFGHYVANPVAGGNFGRAVVFERVQVFERAVYVGLIVGLNHNFFIVGVKMA